MTARDAHERAVGAATKAWQAAPKTTPEWPSKAADAALRAALASLHADGFRVVPVEATDGMADWAYNVWNENGGTMAKAVNAAIRNAPPLPPKED